MVTKERRKAPRAETNVLAAVRCLKDDVVTWSGFARTLNLSTAGALLETPDKFKVDQALSLDFLLDDDRVAQVRGVVVRVEKVKKINHVAVTFEKVPAATRRLLAKQSPPTEE